MASVTFTIDPAILEAARLEAERRETSLHQMVADYIASVAHIPELAANPENLVRLMNEGILGYVDRPVSRDEIYAERTWPRL